jgi:chromosomal replication initiation ATPase DnaA
MTPTTRIFNELLAVTARTYNVNLDRLTTEERMPGPKVREARQVIFFIGSDTLGLTTRELGQLMQRDATAASWAIRRCRRQLKKRPVLRRTVEQLSRHIREYVRHVDMLAAEAAE